MDTINSACNLFHNFIKMMKYCDGVAKEKELKNEKAHEVKEDDIKHYVKYPNNEIWDRIYKTNVD